MSTQAFAMATTRSLWREGDNFDCRIIKVFAATMIAMAPACLWGWPIWLLR
jgi:hypothetical protein